MRVGITCYPTYGGSGIVATELGLELARRGYEVHFISYAHPIRLSTSLPGVHYHEVEVSAYPLFLYPPYVMALASRMVEIAERQRLDLLHVHYAIPHAVAAYLAREMATGIRLPFVTTLHGTDITIVGSDPAYFRTTQFSMQQSDALTTISSAMRDQTRAFFKIDQPIDVIPNFVNCDIYRPLGELKSVKSVKSGTVPDPGSADPGSGTVPDRTSGSGTVPDRGPERTFGDCPRFGGERPRILHLSNFRPVKRVLDCIRAFHLVRRVVNCELWMAGEGPDRGPAEQLAQQLGLSEHVFFLGKRDNVEHLFPQAQAFHLPSENEGFGLAALEAMACGVPPVATQAGGIPDLITHGEDGFLEPVGDVEAQARRLAELLTDATLHRRMAIAARQTALTRFCSDLIIPRYEAVYKRVLEQK